MSTYYYTSELYHHGIKGQKWGLRRFQNEDGTYTEEGKKRRHSDDYEDVKELKKKGYKNLSNAELRKVNERDELESKYKQKNPGAIKKGLAVVGGLAAAIGTLNLLYQNSDNLIRNGKKVISIVKDNYSTIEDLFNGMELPL